MEAPGLSQETVHGNLGLQQFLANSLQYSRDLSTGYVKGKKWYVDGDAGGSGNGKTWKSPFKTFAEAVAALSDDDHIYIAPGTYNEGVTHTITENNVKIIGAMAGNQLAVKANLASYVDGDDEGSEDLLQLDGEGIEVFNLLFQLGNGYWGIKVGDDVNPSGINIHGCYFYSGAQGGGKGVEMGRRDGTQGNAVSMMVDNNIFFKCGVGVSMDGSRQTVRNNLFLAYGQTSIQVKNPQAGSQRGMQMILNNKFIVTRSPDGERGIKFAGTPTVGTVMVDGNSFMNFEDATHAVDKLAGYGGRNWYNDQFLTDANPPVATNWFA